MVKDMFLPLQHSSAVLLDEIASILKAPLFTASNTGATHSSSYLSSSSKPGCLLNLAHAFWQHSSVVELTLLTRSCSSNPLLCYMPKPCAVLCWHILRSFCPLRNNYTWWLIAWVELSSQLPQQTVMLPINYYTVQSCMH